MWQRSVCACLLTGRKSSVFCALSLFSMLALMQTYSSKLGDLLLIYCGAAALPASLYGRDHCEMSNSCWQLVNPLNSRARGRRGGGEELGGQGKKPTAGCNNEGREQAAPRISAMLTMHGDPESEHSNDRRNTCVSAYACTRCRVSGRNMWPNFRCTALKKKQQKHRTGRCSIRSFHSIQRAGQPGSASQARVNGRRASSAVVYSVKRKAVKGETRFSARHRVLWRSAGSEQAGGRAEEVGQLWTWIQMYAHISLRRL